ncbi:hypothetical protein [Shewanella sp. UCD-FRSSP16_17]|uniref:hypothetical protein n=1 Tax=Shewanella sp. UCD-FRSSP16_17 TaxID=1853256 RepID=UPI0012E71B62|nr:hypothetical protein [Shewanella sp. UCD-FRSSP16_17]
MTDILKAVHDSVAGLKNAGLLEQSIMNEFDTLCEKTKTEQLPENQATKPTSKQSSQK